MEQDQRNITYIKEEWNMFAEKVIRWSGIALALGEVLAALFWILHPAGYQTEHILDLVDLMLL